MEAAKIVGIPPMPEVENKLNVVYLDLDGTHHYEMELSDGFMKKHEPEVGGYIVRYEDGYTEAREKADCDEAEPTMGLDFGRAIRALKAGKRVARAGWNGKGMFLWLLPAGQVPKSAIHDPALRAVIDEHTEGDTFNALPSIRMWTRDSTGRWGVLTGWLASQTDMLSEDWQIIE